MTPEETVLLNDLTLVILSYNHPFQLERSLEHWRRLPVKVYVLDGSKKPWFGVGPLPSAPNVIYTHIPKEDDESSIKNYQRRAKIIRSLPLSKYAALIGDDDFFTTAGLICAIKYLESHNEIDAVIGKCVMFNVQDREITWIHKYKDWRPNENSSDPSIVNRLRNDHSLGFIYYGILRSEKLKSIHFRANGIMFSNQKYNELIAHTLGRAYCTISLIDNVLWLRDGKVTRPDTSEIGNYLLNGAADELVAEIFEEAFSDIDGSISPKELRELAVIEMLKLKNLLLKSASKYEAREKLSWTQNAKTLIKESLVKLISKSHPVVHRIIFSIISPRKKTRLRAVLQPDFDERKYFEELLLRNRIDFHLHADAD